MPRHSRGCYESLNGNLRLVLSDRGFKQLSDPNATVVYRGNLLFLTMGMNLLTVGIAFTYCVCMSI